MEDTITTIIILKAPEKELTYKWRHQANPIDVKSSILLNLQKLDVMLLWSPVIP